ncbi:MAG TPA: beta-galactosidase [Candidatus Hydrogenedentes bacterium]|nr:beta-galactosidase [Candidatus Hydrogenedentota bacterium]
MGFRGVIAVALAAFGSVGIAYAGGEPTALWSGQAGPGIEQWTRPKGLEARVEDGVLRLDVREPDAWIYREGIELDPGRIETFVIRYRASGFDVARTHGELFYMNALHGIADQGYIMVPSLVLDGHWHELVLSVEGATRGPFEDWAKGGTVTGLRVDLVDESPGTIEIASFLAYPALRKVDADDIAVATDRYWFLPTDSFEKQKGGPYRRRVIVPEGRWTVWAHAVDSAEGQGLVAGLGIEDRELDPLAFGTTGLQKWYNVATVDGGELELTLAYTSSVLFDAILIAERGVAPYDLPRAKLEPVESAIEPETAATAQILRPYWTGQMITCPGAYGTDHATSLFRHTIDVPANMVDAWLQVSADDGFNLFVNGREVTEGIGLSSWMEPAVLDISPLLTKGAANMLAFRLTNGGGPCGLLVDLTINRADHSHMKIVSDETWRCAIEAPEDWMQPGSDDGGWIAPETRGAPPTAPWARELAYADKTWQTPTACVGHEIREVVEGGELQTVSLRLRSDSPVTPGEVVSIELVDDATGKSYLAKDIALAEDTCMAEADNVSSISGISIPISKWYPAARYRVRLGIYGRALEPNSLEFAFEYRNATAAEPLESHVAMVDGFPRLVVNGEAIYPLVGNGEGRDKTGTRESYAQAGFNIEAIWVDGMSSEQWWRGPGDYAFEHIDAKIIDDLDYNPEVLILPIVWAAPPLWWQELHPDEMALFSDGTTWPYYKSAHSFNSEVWRSDAAEALTAFVNHVEAMSYASRVLGYWIIGGVSAEWQGWGCHASHAANHLMDYSRPAAEAFRQFVEVRYPDLAAASAIPTLEERLAKEIGVFRDPAARLAIAYDEFYSESMADALLGCLGAVKQASQRRKIVGAYFGYSLEYTNMAWAHHMSGHNRLRKVLDSPDIDFFSAPPSYAVRRIGENLGWMWPFHAMQLAGKLVWVDDDTRTYRSGVCDYSPVVNPRQTIAAIQRNFSKALCRMCPQGFLQIESGHELDDPDVAKDIRAIRRAGEYLIEENVERKAEIAVVVDEDSVKYLGFDAETLPSGETDRIVHWNGNVVLSPRHVSTLMGDLVSYQRDRIDRIGAPVDYLLFSDIAKHDTNYKLYIMLSCFQYDDALLDAVRTKLYGRPTMVLWCYAPGFVHDGTANVGHMEALTGMRFGMRLDPMAPRTNLTNLASPLTAECRSGTFGVEYAFAPLFFLNDDAAKPLGVYAASGQVSLGLKRVGEATAVFCGSNKVPTELLRGIAKAAGVHVYCNSGDPFEANERFLTLHSSSDGNKTFRLKEPADVVDVFGGQVLFEQVDRFSIHVPAEETRLFFVGDGHRFLDYVRGARLARVPGGPV